MARSGLSDRIVINGQDEEAMWQPVEHPIAQGFSTIDLHLSKGGYVAKSDSSDRILISTVDQEEL